ncbi:MAG: hypothetical protein QOK49_3575 [Baekduia sp.]|jgi:MFS family permease|nr:hypothetical protein [Baekduia sp.]
MGRDENGRGNVTGRRGRRTRDVASTMTPSLITGRAPFGTRAGIGVAAADLALVLAGNTLPTPLFPAYREKWGLSSGTLTAVFAVYVVGIVVSLVVGGRLSDQIGRRPVLTASLAIVTVSAVLGLVAPSVEWLYAARVLQGLSAGLVSGAAAAAITELTPDRSRAARTTALASMSGIASGLLIVGALAQDVPEPTRTPWAVYLALLIPAAILTQRLPETSPSRSPVTIRLQRLAVPAGARMSFTLLAAGGALAFSCVGLFAALGPTLVVSLLSIDNVLVGAAVASVAYLSSGATQLALRGRAAPPAAGLAILAMGLGILIAAAQTATAVLLVLAAAVIGLGHGLAFLGTLAAVNRLTAPDQRGAVASTYFLANYLGVSVPVLGVGLLADATSLLTATTGFAIVIGGLLLLLLTALVRTGRMPESEPAVEGQPS